MQKSADAASHLHDSYVCLRFCIPVGGFLGISPLNWLMGKVLPETMNLLTVAFGRSLAFTLPLVHARGVTKWLIAILFFPKRISAQGDVSLSSRVFIAVTVDSLHFSAWSENVDFFKNLLLWLFNSSTLISDWKDKLVVLTTEWLPWLQANWRNSGFVWWLHRTTGGDASQTILQPGSCN